MKAIRVRVENGRIVGEAPPGIPEGSELDLCLVDPGDHMSDEEVALLNQALEAGWRCIEEGRFRPAGDVIADLRRKQ